MKTTKLFLLTLLLTLTGALGASAQTKEAYYDQVYVYNILDEPDEGIKSNKVTFYYDNLKETRSNPHLLPTNGGRLEISAANTTSITFDSSFAEYRPTNTSSWFKNLYYGYSIIFSGMENLNTSEVTDMSYMFYGINVTTVELDLTHFNTSKATDMSYMLAKTSGSRSDGQRSFDLSSFTFKSSTNTAKMLENSTIGALTLPASANTLASDAFSGVGTASNPCTLIYQDGFSPQSAEQFDGYITWKGGYFKEGPKAYAVFDGSTLTFYYDKIKESRPGTKYGLNTGFDDPEWNEKHTLVETVVFDPSFANAHPRSGYKWFYVMDQLTSIIGIENLKTDKMTNMEFMFSYCSSLTSLDLSSFNTDKLTDMYGMFSGCTSLTSLDLSGFNTTNVNHMSFMFLNCSSLTSLDLSGFIFKEGVEASCFLMNTPLQELVISNSANNLSTNAFYGLGTDTYACTLLHPSDFTPSNTTQYNGYFKWKEGYFQYDPKPYAVLSTDSKALTFYFDSRRDYRGNEGTSYDLNDSDIPGWYNNSTKVETVNFTSPFKNTSPTSCYAWFAGMQNLSSINGMEYLKTNEVRLMTGMFDNCSSLTSLDLSGFITSNVTDMSYMFYNCSSMTSLDLSSFNTANVTDMSNMFCYCQKLESLDLSSFSTAKVTNMSEMFRNCTGLTSLDLSGFDTRKVTKMSSMFIRCYSLTNLDLRSFIFNESVQSYGLFNGTPLEKLTLPITANNLASNALLGVGTEDNPCVLIYPNGIPDDAEQFEGYFIWKSGYFKYDGLPGDANGDGNVTVADVMLTVNKVMNKPVASFNERNADINNDGRITVADVMGIVKLVLNSGSKSAPRNAFQSMSDAMAVTAKGNELTLHLTGTGSYTASQMMLTLPEGCRLESAQMVSSRSNGHSVLTSDLGNGQYRVMIYGITGLPFGNSCSDLVRLNVRGNHNGDVAVSDIQVVDYLTNTFLLSDVSGIATGIDSIGSDISDGDWYTTQGQKVATPTRGVYIRNGKKVVVR